MYNNTVKEGKTMAVISYITIIGLVIAFVMNQKKQNYFASFHIRQATGLTMLNFVISLGGRFLKLGYIADILSIGALILTIMGLISAIQGEEKKIPLLGDQFQEWFHNIG